MTEAYAVRVLDVLRGNGETMFREYDGTHLA
jgi:hypothetical protein